MKAIKVEGLCKSFKSDFWSDKKQILFDVSFSVEHGVCTGFVGANGSGKTTSLKCILGFLKPDSGNIFFSDQRLSTEIKKTIGYLPERPYLYEFLTAKEFLEFHWKLSGASGDFSKAMIEVLNRVDLKDVENKMLRTFSKGMLQRIGVAQAIIHSPKLLIMDEPMSGLDPDGRYLIKEVIRQEIKKGTTIFFSSHLLSDVQELCENLLIMDRGRVLFNGKQNDLLKEGSSLEDAFIKVQRQFRENFSENKKVKS